MRHHQQGQLSQAEALYRQVLEEAPRHGDALHLLGVLALQAGDGPRAVELIRMALGVNPEFPVAMANLGGIILR